MEKVALLFPGGGTQYVGMGRRIYDEFAVARHVFEEANDVLGYDLAKLCFEGSLGELSAMLHAQPAVFTTSVATSRVYDQEIGVVPAFVAGHSLGEYAALVYTSVFPFDEALRLVRRRGELLQEAGIENNAGMMAVNKIGSHVLEEKCREINEKGGMVYISVYNSPLQHVVSGRKGDIEKLAAQLAHTEAEATVLNIRTPSHCPLMHRAADAFRQELAGSRYREPTCRVISNISATPYTAADDFVTRLTDHMVKPVQWQKSIEYMADNGIRTYLDVGPQAILKNLVRYIRAEAQVYAFDSPADVRGFREACRGVEVHFAAFLKRCLVLAVSTRNFNEDEREYEEQVLKRYEQLRGIREEAEGKTPTESQVTQSLELVAGILLAKKIPAEKRYGHLLKVIHETNLEPLLLPLLDAHVH